MGSGGPNCAEDGLVSTHSTHSCSSSLPVDVRDEGQYKVLKASTQLCIPVPCAPFQVSSDKSCRPQLPGCESKSTSLFLGTLGWTMWGQDACVWLPAGALWCFIVEVHCRMTELSRLYPSHLFSWENQLVTVSCLLILPKASELRLL